MPMKAAAGSEVRSEDSGYEEESGTLLRIPVAGMQEGTDVQLQTVVLLLHCRMRWKAIIIATTLRMIKFH